MQYTRLETTEAATGASIRYLTFLPLFKKKWSELAGVLLLF